MTALHFDTFRSISRACKFHSHRLYGFGVNRSFMPDLRLNLCRSGAQDEAGLCRQPTDARQMSVPKILKFF
jgi:hypothetical protein